MHLLDSEQLELAFQLHRVDHDVLARRLYQEIWAQIKLAERASDQAALASCRLKIHQYCEAYFAAMRQWSDENAEDLDPRDITNRASRANAEEAVRMLPVLEQEFIRYALCYLELSRVLVRARRGIIRLADDINIEKIETPAIDHATGILLLRLHRERAEMMEKRLRLDRARDLLSSLDPMLEKLGADLPRRLGQDRGDRELTRFKSELRKRRYAAAIDHGSRWPEALAGLAREISDYAHQHEESLATQDSMILHSGEIKLIASFLAADEAKATARIDRLNLPYMVFQYRVLLQNAVALGRIGTLESLIILHAKLYALQTRSDRDSLLAQRDLQNILLPARALINDFRQVGSILAATETGAAILEKLFAKTGEYRPAIAK